MTKVAVTVAAVALLTGCAGSTKASGAGPVTALLTNVKVRAASVEFDFRSAPRTVRATYVSRSALAECGSGKPVPLKGAAYAVIHFVPAMTAVIKGDKVTPTYKGPRRIEGSKPVREVVKTCDFESDVAWAVGVQKRLPFHVVRKGGIVTLRFG